MSCPSARAARTRAAMSGAKIASWAASVAGSRAAPSARSERASSGSDASGIGDVERRVSREFGVRDGGACAGALLVAADEVWQPIGREPVAREPEHTDRALDLLR